MTPTSDKLSAAAEANRRFARLAVAWFDVDADQVAEKLRAAQEVGIDFLDVLTEASILTRAQADRLRFDHAPSDFDDATHRIPTKLYAAEASDPKQLGPYRILRRLGVGGMGAVYLAFDGKDNCQFAVKVLSAEHAPKQNILQRFHREGKNGSTLIHPNIVRTCDSGRDEASGLHYIVLEYVDGPTAHDLLDRAGKLKVGDALHIILDIARALEHAHKHLIIHRDIKPANILVTSSGRAKLSDLGLAKRRDDPASITHADQGIGTPYYMPYEQAMNAKMADERSDVYALGATLYHLVTGEVPFPGESSLEIVERKGMGAFTPAGERNPDVPAKLDQILAKMMARNPEDRYQTVSEVIVDLERSQLVAAIPSFVKLDTALQDPVVREQLTSPIEPTQPDLQIQQQLEERAKQIWFLLYTDQRGNACKAKGSHAEIVSRLSKGTIPPTAEASRSPTGKFQPIGEWPEFQEAVTAALAKATMKAAEADKDEDRWKPWWIAGAGVAALLLAILAIILGGMFLGAW